MTKIKKILKAIPYKIFFAAVGIELLVLFIAILGTEIPGKVEVFGINEISNTVKNILGEHITILEKCWIRVPLFIIFVLTIVLLTLKIIYKPNAMIIEHSSFSNNIAEYNQKLFKGYTKKEAFVNITDEMNSNKKAAIIKQDKLVNDIKSTLNKKMQLCYYGIAHIPLIMRMGYQFGDESNVILLHKMRNNSSEFDELGKTEDFHVKPFAEIIENFNGNRKALLVTIAISLPITNADISVFYTKVGAQLRFEVKNKDCGFDLLNSYSCMERFKDEILSSIHDYTKKHNINCIHMVLATSSEFAFFLSQGFSNTYDPKIIVYQYCRQSKIKYPWGIDIMEKSENSLVEMEKKTTDKIITNNQ